MSCHIHPDRQAGPSSSSNEASTSSTRGGKGGRGPRLGGNRVRVGSRAAIEGTSSSIPTGSVSKLKAQLRQTKRLLARQDLTPDVRTTTERRLATLESELIMAQDSTLEKKMVVRYKGVKFFERQKCLRKIRQALKVNPPTPLSIRTLFEARADLYYVLHFPIKEKYIALFPEGQYVPFVEEGEELLKGSERKRWQVRNGFRALLERGEVDEEVEKGVLGIQGEHDHEEEGDVNENGKRGREGQEEEAAEEEKEKEEGKKKSRKMGAEAPNESEKKKPFSTKSNKKEPPALASAPKPVSTSTKPTTTPTEADATEPLSKKNRKAEKDAKRKAAKEGTLTNKVSTEEKLEPKGWAGDDDFFA